MSVNIYYFTGTGNSLKVAKDLAKELGETKLVKICKTNLDSIAEAETDKVGIVFPVYYYGMPLIVKTFIEKLSISKGTYIFSVATCGGSVGVAFKQLEEILLKKELNLSAAFRIIMPDNYQILYGPSSSEKQLECFKIEQESIKEITSIISNNKAIKFQEKGKYLTKAFGGVLSSSFKPYHKDKNFWVDDKCNSCGTCKKLCPVNNIQMQEEKPVWQNKCEQCLACMQWCPKQSIQYKKSTIKRARYHNPNIKIQELF